ncbi:MAG: dipeptidase [Myxococcota bacterium]
MTLRERAADLAKELLIVDGHIDLPYRLDRQRERGDPVDDPSGRTPGGHFDAVRARAGGLNAPFMAIYVPADYQSRGGAKAKADQLIDLVEGLAAEHPDTFQLASTPDAIVRAVAAGRIALPMGLENGAALESDLTNIAHFYRRGIRYITLTHSRDNQIGDSSYDSRRSHRGLSEFGKSVIVEMNRIGMMVDVSHVSDRTFDDVLELARVPPIASHSSCRHFTPGWERNISDESIRKLAGAGGVVMINFGTNFLRRGDSKTALPVTARHVADHIEHVVRLVGIEHVGIGSDYDGVPKLPADLQDVSSYPVLLEELLRRGYRDADLEKITSGNILRVWRDVSG